MSDATVNIPRDVLEPIIRNRIAAAIVSELGNPEQLITKAVENSLRKKVNSKGEVDLRYACDNKHDLVEVLATQEIHRVTREALTKWVEEQRPAIEEQVKRALAKKQGAFAKALVDGLVNATKSTWSFKCDIHFKE